LIAHRLLGLVIGAVAGSSGWFALTPDATPAPAETTPKAIASASTPVRSSCPEEAQLRTQLAALDAQITGAAVGVAVAGAQQVEAIGARIEPPSALPPELEESAIESAVIRIAAEYGGIVAGLDCGEYPCIASVIFPPLTPESVDLASEFREAARERWPNLYTQDGFSPKDFTSSVTMAFLADPISQPSDTQPSDERRYVDFLVKEARKTFSEEAKDARAQLAGEREQGE